MAKCEVCQKDMFFGRKIRITRSQISRRALTTQQANVHRVKVVVDGTPKTMPKSSPESALVQVPFPKTGSL